MQYVKIKNLSAKRFELLPVSPVFVHPKNKAKKPGYYSDIIMHADFEKTVKSFIDLRGSNWAYTRDHSLSSSLTIRKLLRSFGENSTFFGNTKMTENHLLSVKMVQDKQVTAAAVDSVAFYNYKNVLHKDSEDIRVFDSIGPHPPYAVVCSKTLPVELKTKIINALFTISLKQTWADKFEKFGLIKFAVNSDDSYTDLGFTETTESNRGLSSVYY
jgi:ABC-type phosphate/phosphonate transport system substrate-binding protein